MRSRKAINREPLKGSRSRRMNPPSDASKTYPRLYPPPLHSPIPARHKGRGKLERLTRGRERFPGEPSCVPLRTPAQGRSPHIPGRAIEAVRAWQQTARTPFGSGRSNYRAAVADGPGTMARPCGLGPKLAAVVSAPSAMRDAARGRRKAALKVATGSQRFGARAPFGLCQTSGVSAARMRVLPSPRSCGER